MCVCVYIYVLYICMYIYMCVFRFQYINYLCLSPLLHGPLVICSPAHRFCCRTARPSRRAHVYPAGPTRPLTCQQFQEVSIFSTESHCREYFSEFVPSKSMLRPWFCFSMLDVCARAGAKNACEHAQTRASSLDAKQLAKAVQMRAHARAFSLSISRVLSISRAAMSQTTHRDIHQIWKKALNMI